MQNNVAQTLPSPEEQVCMRAAELPMERICQQIFEAERRRMKIVETWEADPSNLGLLDKARDCDQIIMAAVTQLQQAKYPHLMMDKAALRAEVERVYAGGGGNINAET